MSGADLSFTSAPDYENPADSDRDNVYQLRLRVTDASGLYDELDLNLSVLDVNEAPTALISVILNQSGSTITTATQVTLDGSASSDPDGDILSYSWSEPDGQDISLSTTTDVNTSFTATTPGTYTFTLTVSDGELSDSEVVTVLVHPVTIPDDFAASAGDANVTLTWTPYSDETTYSIYRSTDPNCDLDNYAIACAESELIANVSSPVIDTGLTNGTTYYYWIEATLDGVTQRSLLPINATPRQPVVITPKPLNDTGIDWGGDYDEGNNADCSSNIDATQDCDHGRDATDNDDSDGHAGFSFTRLNADGSEYLGSGIYSDEPWSCVQDNVTGLIWEVKTDDGGLRDKDDRYNWYNTDPATNGGFNGYADDDGNICYGYNSSDSATYCNTEAFAARVNAVGLCGATDWRVPDIEELRSIVDYSRIDPSIDTDYFPNTRSSGYWSASPYASNSSYAWRLYFYDGYDFHNGRYHSNYVRLVRVGQ